MTRFALFLLLAAWPAQPVAPTPEHRRLTAELMTGRWAWDWGGYKDGWIVFMPDGRYYSRHSPGAEPDWTGFWWVRGTTLTLWEGRCPCDLTPVTCSALYPVTLRTARYPVLAGECRGTVVVLRRAKL